MVVAGWILTSHLKLDPTARLKVTASAASLHQCKTALAGWIPGDRPACVRKAIAAGKHIHIEKPNAPSTDEAMALARAAHVAGVKHGVIQDKLFLPGLAKLLFLKQSGFFGRILSVRIDAGSWIFDGTLPSQRPSWNYKRAEGGGIALDMMAHRRYMVDADMIVQPVMQASKLGRLRASVAVLIFGRTAAHLRHHTQCPTDYRQH